MDVGAGWTTGLSNGYGAVPSMKTFTCKITAADWMLVADWGAGLRATTRSGPIRRWAMRPQRKCIWRPTRTALNQPPGKRCNLEVVGTASLATLAQVGRGRKLANKT